MVKGSKPLGAETVSTYYRVEHGNISQRNYFRETEQGKNLIGEWHGKLAAERFGLAPGSGVDDVHYNRLALGQDPHTGEQLIKHRPPAEISAWAKSDVAWRDRLEELYCVALEEKRDVFRKPPETEWRGKLKPFQPKPGKFDASLIPIEVVWRDLGGGEIKPGRNNTAFWRNGDAHAVSIDTEKGVWYDHVQGEGGGTIKLVATANGCSKSEAARYLKEHYSEVPVAPSNPVEKPVVAPVNSLPEKNVAGDSPEMLERRGKLLEMHRIAAETFAENLVSDAGAGARGYLDTRGVSEEARREFGIGVSSPDGRQLVDRLSQFGPELMDASGLFWRDDRGEFHDRFRDRLMFPIQDRDGQVIAFAGRQLSEGGKGGKYVNSRETELYKKSEVLYNMHRAKAAGTGRVVGVEGYMDVIAGWSAGVKDIVALSGTSLSAGQAQQIAGVASDVILNLDPDKAGREAASNRLETLHAAGLRCRILDLPSDPDEFIQDCGAEAYQNRLKSVRPLVEWLSARAREQFDVADSWGRADAGKWVMGHLESVPVQHRDHMLTEVARYLKVPRPEEEEKAKHSEHVSAIDWTVAPNKSYSAAALVGGDRRIIHWHQNATREMADAMEEYTQARLRDTAPLTTANWAAAIFMHDTARPVNGAAPNPHLHSHLVAFNMTADGEKVRSMNPQELYRIQSYGSAVYQASMARQALEGGYQLDHGKNFSTRIKGFSDEYLEAISARKNEIEAEKERQGIVGAEADEHVNKQLRQAKQQWDPAELRAEHKRQAAEFVERLNQGLSPGEKPWRLPEEIVAESRERPGFVMTAEQRQRLAHLAIMFARDRLQENQAVNDHYEIMRDALRFGMGKLVLADVKAAFEQHEEFIEIKHYRENAPGARYTTNEMREVELECIQLTSAGKGSTEPIAPTLTRDQFRDWYKFQVVDGKKIELNNPQMWLGFKALTSPHQYVIVRGAAGVGKSTAMEPIAEVATREGFEIHGLASTSPAAKNLATLGIESETIQAHNRRPIDPEAQKRLYIIDEGSLVGARMFHSFVRSVRPQDRVIVAYDPRQHQAVEAGRIIEEMEQAGVPFLTLEKIVRQQSPELRKVIEQFKHGHPTKGLRMLDEDFDRSHVHSISDRKKRLEYMAMWYVLDPHGTLIAAPDNRTIQELNSTVRAELLKTGQLGQDLYEARVLVGARDIREADRKRAVMYGSGNIIRWGKGIKWLGVKSGDYAEVVRVDAEANLVTMKLAGREITYDPRNAYGVEIYNTETRKFAIGEKIQITRPWKGHRLANRETGFIRALDRFGNAVVEFKDGRKITWKLADMPHVDYAYAMTTYSLQYATSKNILLHIDVGDSRIRTLLDKSMVYVGGSRGAEMIEVFTDDKKILLGENSPVERLALKPKALSEEQIQQIGIAS